MISFFFELWVIGLTLALLVAFSAVVFLGFLSHSKKGRFARQKRKLLEDSFDTPGFLAIFISH